MKKILLTIILRTKLLVTLLIVLLLFQSCDEYESRFKSYDMSRGRWTEVPYKIEGLTKLFFVDDKNGWAIGDNGEIAFSLTGGKTWYTVTYSSGSALTSVFFIDKKNGFVSGMDKTLLYSIDGGVNWNTVNISSDFSTVYSSISRDDMGNLWFITNYGEVFCSTNSGRDWISKSKLNDLGYVYEFFANPSCGFAMKATDGKLMKTIDGGLNWNSYSIPTQCKWMGDVFFLDEKYGWYSENWKPSSAGESDCSLYKTLDGGETWNKAATLSGSSINKIFFLDPNNGWIALNDEILYTADGGKTWEIQYQTKDGGIITDIFFASTTGGWALTSTYTIIRYSKI